MSILLDRRTRVVVLGITGRYAASQTNVMMQMGTNVVAGASTGRAGQTVHGVPVFDTLAEAVATHPADAVALHVGPQGMLEAVREAVDAGFRLIFVGTEGIPPHDVMQMRALARRADAWMVGPNSLGLITPGEAMLGAIPPEWCLPGRVGMMSRSGTLCLFVLSVVTQAGIGQSTVITIGGDQVIGRNPIDYLRAFESDPDTDAVLMLSEVGGRKDHEAADFVRSMSKPVVALFVGHAAPAGRRMGHIGAVIGAADEGAQAKGEVLRKAGAHVAETWHEVPGLLTSVLPPRP